MLNNILIYSIIMTLYYSYNSVIIKCDCYNQERMSVAKRREGASNSLNQLLSNQGLKHMSIYGHNCKVFCILIASGL